MGLRATSAIVTLLFSGATAQAQDDCFRKVVEFSEGICAEFVELEGGGQSVDLEGELNAELNGIFSAITDIGGRFGGSLSRDEYTNILREDIPSALEGGRTCRLDVAKSFYDKICGAPEVQGAVQDTTFTRDALIDDPDGWTNVRSGPGTQYQAFTRVVEDEVFRTFVQRDPWWQVQLSDGRVGFVHGSRIRLVD